MKRLTERMNWIWIVGIALIVALILCAGMSVLLKESFRAKVCREFVTYLKEEMPGITVVIENDSSLQLQLPGREKARLSIIKLHKRVAESEEQGLEARKKIYGEFVQIIREFSSLSLSDDPERYRTEIFPLLITPDYLKTLQEVRPEDGTIFNRQLEGTGLFIVYVIDNEHSMLYISEKVLNKIRISQEHLHEIAVKNLRQRFPEGIVRKVIEKNAFSSIKMMDGYDAARLLLVPEYLKEGESLAALVPDGNILTITLPPKDGDWSQLQKLAKIADGEPLLNRPILVTKKGFELK